MHKNTHVLNKRFATLTLMLFSVTFTATTSWAQQAHERQAPPTHTLSEKASVQSHWTVVGSKKKGSDFARFYITDLGDSTATGGGGGGQGPEDPSYEVTGFDGGKGGVQNNNEGGSSGGSGGDPSYERVLEDRLTQAVEALAPARPAAVVGNYPNPFNPETTIRFEVQAAQPVRLAVYNTLGQQVQLLVDGWVEAGVHEARFDGYGLPSGTYFTRLVTETGMVTRTMVLAK